MHIAETKRAAFEVAELVEHKQRIIRRYEKTDICFAAFINVVAIFLWAQ